MKAFCAGFMGAIGAVFGVVFLSFVLILIGEKVTNGELFQQLQQFFS